MKNIVKRIAAMGAAVMMMSSMAIGASAADSFSFYISNTGSVTSKVINARNAAQDDYVRVNYRIDKISNATSVSYRTTVGGTYIASGEISSKGNHTRNTLMRHILIKVNVFCAPCHSIQLRQV